VGKSGVLEHKSGNISETRKDRGKVTMEYGWPKGSLQRSFEPYHVPSPTPTASSSSRFGVRKPHPKPQSLLSQERVKLRTSNVVITFMGSIGTKDY